MSGIFIRARHPVHFVHSLECNVMLPVAVMEMHYNGKSIKTRHRYGMDREETTCIGNLIFEPYFSRYFKTLVVSSL